MVCASLEHIYHFLTKFHGNTDKQTVSNFLSLLTPQTAHTFTEKGCQLYYADVYPGCAFYLPPGFQFWEQISKDQDYVRAKIVVMMDAAKEVDEIKGKDTEQIMSGVNMQLIMHNIENIVLQSVVMLSAGAIGSELLSKSSVTNHLSKNKTPMTSNGSNGENQQCTKPH